MTTAYDLENHAQEASKAYLERNIPLNESIRKTAEEQGLNGEQINRVVEKANVLTHVALFNKSAEKYVEFENADSASIKDSIHGTEKVASAISSSAIEDYFVEPHVSTSMEKQASSPMVEERPLTEQEALNQIEHFQSSYQQLDDRAEETKLQFKTAELKLHSLVKQAVLSGTTFGDVVTALHTVASTPVTESFLKEASTLLKEDGIKVNLEKTADTKYSVNISNPLIATLLDLNKVAEEYKTLRTKQAELRKEADGKKSAWRFLKYPAVFLAGMAAKGYVDSTTEEQKNSYLNQPLPLKFQR